MEQKQFNPCFGWILEDNPTFWEDNGYELMNYPDFHYFGCESAKLNKFPIHRKQLYINYDMEDEAAVEVFPCEIGNIKHNYIVAVYVWNNAGGCSFPLKIAKQVSTVWDFNKFILANTGDVLQNGRFRLSLDPKNDTFDGWDEDF